MSLLTARCSARDGDPRDWPAFQPTDCDDYDMQAAYSYCTWRLERVGKRIHAASSWYEKEPVSTVNEFPQGFLVGYNTGEWGGGLYWYSRDGELRQRLLGENVIRTAPFGDKLVVFTGLAHGFSNNGEASLLAFDGSKWNVIHSLDLTGAPFAFLDEPSGVTLIATSKRIVRLTNASRIEVLHRSKAGFSYPSTIVKDDDGTLYLGTRYVVVRLKPRGVTYDETWLAPPGATRPRPPNEPRY